MKFSNGYPVFTDEFKSECKVMNLEKEYPGYVGDVKYMIFSDLSKEQIENKHGHMLEKFRPYEVDSMKTYQIIHDAHLEEERQEYEIETYHSQISLDTMLDESWKEVSNSLIDDSLELSEKVGYALQCLTESQKRRLFLYCFEEKTFDEIAEMEHVSKQAVLYSIKAAKKNFKKIF